MGTAAVKQTVTPRAIADAKARAMELNTLAYAPQPVKQPDGSTLALCWTGRIARAYERLAAARTARNTAAIDALKDAIATLESKAAAAMNAAEHAASDWAAMCAAVGQPCDPDEVYAPPCTCEGCRMQAAYMDKAEARAKYVTALYDLLAPTSFDLPPFMELGRLIQAGDQEAQKRMTAYWRRIYEAGVQYIEAHRAAGTRPNWRALWPDEEE